MKAKNFFGSIGLSVAGSLIVASGLLYLILGELKDNKSSLQNVSDKISGNTEKYFEFIEKHNEEHDKMIKQLRKQDQRIFHYNKNQMKNLNDKLDELSSYLYKKEIITFKELRKLEKEKETAIDEQEAGYGY